MKQYGVLISKIRFTPLASQSPPVVSLGELRWLPASQFGESV